MALLRWVLQTLPKAKVASAKDYGNSLVVCPTRGGLRKTHPTSKIEFRLTSLNIEQNINIYLIIVIYHYICEKIFNIRIVC